MARMIPDRPSDDRVSRAELAVFDRLARDVDEKWTILHSLKLGKHRTKPWTEIDFVLIGPAGIFCLEVKGGGLWFQDGLYYYEDPRYSDARGDSGPLDQANKANQTLRDYLTKQDGRLSSVLTGFGVVTPDFKFNFRAPDVIPEVICDKRDEGRSFDEYLVRLVAYWAALFPRQGGLTGTQVKEVSTMLRGDFYLRPSLGEMARLVEGELREFTEQQSQVLGMLHQNDRIVVTGGAGTGKTLFALREAIRCADIGQVTYTCFTKDLALYVKRELAAWEPRVKVRTLHGLMRDLIADAGLLEHLPNPKDDEGKRELFDKHFPEAARLALEEIEPSCDMLIIDEGQDVLRSQFADVLPDLVRGKVEKGQWRLFLDPAQDIFGPIQPEVLARFSATAAKASLTENCRNSEVVVRAVERLSGYSIPPSKVSGGSERYRWYQPGGDQSTKVEHEVEFLLKEGVAPDQVVLLSPHTRPNSDALKSLAPGNFEIRHIREQGSDSGAITYATVAGFKGLEADAVILLDIDAWDDEQLRLNYIGASRARAVVVAMLSDQLKGVIPDSLAGMALP